MTLRDPNKVPLKILDARLLCYLQHSPSVVYFGGDDEEDLVSKDDMVWRGTAEGSAGSYVAPPPPRVLLILLQHHHQSDGLIIRCLFVWAVVRHQQIEADPLSLVPLAPHQKLTGISMARN
ncbi:hypothetical protein Tco_0432569 [Tanacetum coccineum]